MNRLAIIIAAVVLIFTNHLPAQDHDGIDQIARVYNFWEFALDVAVQGDYAYAAIGGFCTS